jgi:hypothetical protein
MYKKGKMTGSFGKPIGTCIKTQQKYSKNTGERRCNIHVYEIMER